MFLLQASVNLRLLVALRALETHYVKPSVSWYDWSIISFWRKNVFGWSL